MHLLTSVFHRRSFHTFSSFAQDSILLHVTFHLHHSSSHPICHLHAIHIAHLTEHIGTMNTSDPIHQQTALVMAIARLEAIEEKTRCKITTTTTISEYDSQTPSPPFELPAELRNIFFEYASAQEATDTWPTTAYYYRPGHTGPPKICFNHVLTCRLLWRLWLEANTLPIRQAEHSFWFPRGSHSPSDLVMPFHIDEDAVRKSPAKGPALINCSGPADCEDPSCTYTKSFS